LFLIAATSANADLVPKKLWEFDFKENIGNFSNNMVRHIYIIITLYSAILYIKR